MHRILLGIGRVTAKAICLTGLFIGSAGAGPQVAGTSPTVDEILDKYVRALGGKAALEKISSRVMKGMLDNSGEGTSAPAEIWAKAPNKYFAKADVPDYGAIEEVLDGDKGWTQNPDSGFQSMTPSELAVAKRDYDFYREIRLKEHYPKMTVAGKDQVGDRDTFVIEAKPSSDPAERLYFDAESGLLLKRDYERVTFDEGIVLFEATFEDYREVDGVKVPFVVRRKTPDYTLTYRFSEVKLNVPVDDAKFQRLPK
jgi:zinc protease